MSGGILLKPGDGRSLSLGPMGDALIKAVGPYGVAEFALRPGGMTPPPHIHQRIHEALYVLEGELELAFEGESLRGGPGLFQYVPPGTVHRLAVPGDRPARVLAVVSPADLAVQMLEEISDLFAAGPPSDEAMAELFSRIDMQPVG